MQRAIERSYLPLVDLIPLRLTYSRFATVLADTPGAAA